MQIVRKRLPASNLCKKTESDQCKEVLALLASEPRFVPF